RCVEIVIHRRLELLTRFSDGASHLFVAAGLKLFRFETEYELLDTLQRGVGLAQPVEREVQLFPVSNGDEEITDRKRLVTLIHQVAQREEIVFRLGHLLAFDKQVLSVNPEADEWFSRHRFALRDLVLMMRKDVVDAATMNIERRAEFLHRHRGTFQVPARTALAK